MLARSRSSSAGPFLARTCAVGAALGLSLGSAACSSKAHSTEAGTAEPAPSAEAPSTTSPTPSSAVIPHPVATATSAAPRDAASSDSSRCSPGMVHVEGAHCAALTQRCVEHHDEFASDPSRKTVSERCLRYEEPSRCVSKSRKAMSFCMDRYEYPNEVGVLPRVLTSWKSAKKLCEAAGKRLCTEEEFNFACEGPNMLPYVYGFVRDAKKCNIDREYRYPDHSKVMPEYDECLATDWCKAELDRLDQREKIGARTTCGSWAGVFDLNGNVNEWVDLPKEKPPNRSGLKGGWWGPIRARCRPTVTFHKESDYGYEAGFRCCSDAKPSPQSAG
jgi:formylglycine-generating enzyme